MAAQFFHPRGNVRRPIRPGCTDSDSPHHALRIRFPYTLLPHCPWTIRGECMTKSNSPTIRDLKLQQNVSQHFTFNKNGVTLGSVQKAVIRSTTDRHHNHHHLGCLSITFGSTSHIVLHHALPFCIMPLDTQLVPRTFSAAFRPFDGCSGCL